MNVAHLKKMVETYVKGRIDNRPFCLKSLDDAEFRITMDIIVEELCAAWMAGYMERCQKNEKD